jgi:hypothetical protein
MSQQSQQSQRTISTKASFTFSRSSSTSTSTSVTSHNSSSAAYHKAKLSNAANAAPVAASFSPVSAPRPQPLHQQQHRKEYGESQHPFGPELAQVSELAEEYGVKEQVVSVADVEEQEMLAKGLLKISADEYLSEIRSLFATFFVVPRPVATNWI